MSTYSFPILPKCQPPYKFYKSLTLPLSVILDTDDTYSESGYAASETVKQQAERYPRATILTIPTVSNLFLMVRENGVLTRKIGTFRAFENGTIPTAKWHNPHCTFCADGVTAGIGETADGKIESENNMKISK